MKKGFIQVVVLGLICQNNKYLLTLRKDPKKDMNNKWQIPGGSLEFGESPEQCLRREVMEELGIKVRIKTLLPSIDTIIRRNWHGVLILYLCELADESASITLNHEATEYRWFNKNELEKVDSLPGCVEGVEVAENCIQTVS